MRIPRAALVVSVGLAALAAACSQGQPRQRPLQTNPIEAGPNSLESVRRQFNGTWELVSLDTFPTPGGAGVPVKGARGVLTYDEFGNLALTGTAGTPIVEYKGRAVIDVAKQELYLQAIEGRGGVEELPKEVDPALRRKYAFEGELLKLSTIDAQGRITATMVWKRRS
jgi:hypothetical protein